MTEKPEEEMMTNPKAEDMCRFEEKYYQKCKECPKTLDDQMFCKQNQINIQLSKQNRQLEQIDNRLIDIITLLQKKSL